MRIKHNLTLRTSHVALSLVLLSAFNIRLSTLAQGNLTPPGAPSPTMKSLTQIQPRIDVMTLTGNSRNLFIITAPGSYYLTTNIAGVAGKNGISIQADRVTLDLNGFTLVGGPTNSLAGITTGEILNFNPAEVSIRNGSVLGWGLAGIDAADSVGCELDHLRVSSNGVDAGAFRKNIYASVGATIRDCISEGNTNGGIAAGNNSLIVGCIARFNGAGFGISAGTGSTISGCNVSLNGTGIRASGSVVSDCTAAQNDSFGINSDAGGTVKDCVARLNNHTGILGGSDGTIINCTTSANGDAGIIVFDNTTLKNCTAVHNSGNGIEIETGCQVLDCTASGNGNDGIHASGTGNRIDGNHLTGNSARGIRLSTSNTSIVVRNTATNNASGDFPVAGSNIGPVQSPATATSPWANFSY